LQTKKTHSKAVMRSFHHESTEMRSVGQKLPGIPVFDRIHTRN